MLLPKAIAGLVDNLYREDEYGARFVDLTKRPSEELIQYFVKTHGIQDGVHSMCVGCQIRQLVKYQGKKVDERFSEDKFSVRCDKVPSTVPISEEQVRLIATQKNIPYERAALIAKSTVDPVSWAELMFGFKDTDRSWRLRPYQKEQLRCNAKRVVLREGRRAGKTFVMALKMINLATTLTVEKGYDGDGNKVEVGPEIIILTPFQSQISNIFEEMERLIKRNRSLMNLVQRNNRGNLYTMSPVYEMSFVNGATITGYVTGTSTKQDGSGGGAIRGDSANILYLDEMDMIPEEILKKVVEPLLMTREGVRLYATSTPIGKRAAFYNYCMNRPDFKEFYYPSTSLPAWEEVKHEIIGDNGTDNEVFRSEILAEFVDGSFGVFKPSFIHAARTDYRYRDVAEDIEKWARQVGAGNPNQLIKCMGIDWNKNAGTEFFVVGYSPIQGKWYALDAVNISASKYTFEAYKEAFLQLNYKWRPDYIYADSGYGHTIIEDLKLLSQRLKGKARNDYEMETAKIYERLKAFEFGGKVELRDPTTNKVIVKPGKLFLVETAVRLLEVNNFFYPEDDITLTKQMQNYAVLRMSDATGKPVYGPENVKVGDHRLDAFMLAVGGIYLEQGIYAKNSWAKSTPELITMDEEDLPDFLVNPRTNGASDLDRLMEKYSGNGVGLSVLEVLRGQNHDQDAVIRGKLKAKEWLSRNRSGQPLPVPPPEAYASDNEDVWLAKKAHSQRNSKQGRRERQFTRR